MNRLSVALCLLCGVCCATTRCVGCCVDSGLLCNVVFAALRGFCWYWFLTQSCVVLVFVVSRLLLTCALLIVGCLVLCFHVCLRELAVSAWCVCAKCFV